MALAIILGAFAGVAGFAPLLIGLVMTAVVCIALNRELGFPFVVAEVVALSTVAIAYGVSTVVRK